MQQRRGFSVPKAYTWLVDSGFVPFETATWCQPWYLLSDEDTFSVTDRWPTLAPPAGARPSPSTSEELIAFARRRDCDDVACFSVASGQVNEVVLIHAWTPTGYEITKRYPTLWEWLKDVINDIAELEYAE